MTTWVMVETIGSNDYKSRIMKKVMFFLAATLVFIATGCNKENTVTDDVQYVSELKVNFEGDTKVSAAHSAAGLKFNWEDGDVISILEDGNADSPIYNYVYDASSESFKPYDEGQKMVVGTKYFALKAQYSYYDLITVEEGKSIVKLNLKTGASDVRGLPAIPLISDVFTADASGTVATMHHLCGVVEVPVNLSAANAAKNVNHFSIYSSDGKLAGSYTATPYPPYFLGTSTPSNTAHSEKKTTPYEAGNTTVFIPVLPGICTGVFLNVYYDGGAGGTYIDKDRQLVVERGKITKVTQVNY